MAVELVESPLCACSEMTYGILRTSWGYIAIRWAGNILTGVTLPFANKRDIFLWVKQNWGKSKRDDSVGSSLQNQLKDYYDGKGAEFTVHVDAGWASAFARKVLQRCIQIRPGETISYGELSNRAGFARAARAAGTVMAKNRYPVIIPCHRVISSAGSMGGYSAGGGVELKRRLLEHEKKFFQANRT